MEHFSPANTAAGVQYTPMEMAEYVFWTGDERGVTTAIEVFLQEGMVRNNIFMLYRPVDKRRDLCTT